MSIVRNGFATCPSADVSERSIPQQGRIFAVGTRPHMTRAVVSTAYFSKSIRLLQTLMVYYGESMNRKAAAHALGIHPNTLDYRLRQAERIATAPINSGDYGFRFQLAARLLPIAGLTVAGQSS